MQLIYLLLQAIGWLQGVYDFLITTIKNVKSRKTVLLFGFIAFVCLYLASSYLLPAHRHFHINQVYQREKTSCLDIHLKKWSEKMHVSDAVYKIVPGSVKENRFFPFSGNGYIGFSLEKDHFQFYVFPGHQGTEINFAPVLSAKIGEKFTNQEQAIILDIKGGSVYSLTSYTVNKSCIVAEELFYTHRKHSELFYHEITVQNNGLVPVTFQFQYPQQQKNVKFVTHSNKTKHGEVRYNTISGTFNVPNNPQKIIKMNVATSDFQPTIRVPQKSQNKVNLVSIIQYDVIDKPLKDDKRKRKSTVNYQMDSVANSVAHRLLGVLDILPDTLYEQHKDTWDDIWKVGVKIDSETDPDSPSALHVNLTDYYIFSTFMNNYTKSTDNLIGCFNGPPTLHNAELWVVPSDIKSLERLKRKWTTLFLHSNCITSETVSLYDMRELMVLSFLGLQHQEHHLQLALNPLNLLSNISIRHLSLQQFASKDILDIEIRVNRRTSDRTLHITCTGDHKPSLYGCSTACEHVVKLGSNMLNFPVHTTDPVTPLFYMSTNQTHLEQIGKTSFIITAKLNAKTAHQSHLEVHHMKLSPKFWLAVVILVVSFHVIVFKMIYNECRSNRGGGRRRGPFNS